MDIPYNYLTHDGTDPDESLIIEGAGTVLDKAMREEHAALVPRGHMGMSSIFNPDLRETWMKFRWLLPDKPEARMLRIWDSGNMLEEYLIKLLRKIPGTQVLDVNPETGEQFHFETLGGHFSGSMDGAMLGVTGAPATWHALEFKSAKNSSFKELLKAGSVKDWSTTYDGQIQGYMGEFGLTRALYGVINKDTSEIYWERIKARPGMSEHARITAQDLLEVTGPPNSCYKPESYQIKNLKPQAWQRIYWGEALPPAHCRSCRHAIIEFDGFRRWTCGFHMKDLTVKDQQAGCDQHIYLPALMPADKVEDHGTAIKYKTREAKPMIFWNAPAGANADPLMHVYGSKQLESITVNSLLVTSVFNSPKKNVAVDPVPAMIAKAFGGTIYYDDEIPF